MGTKWNQVGTQMASKIDANFERVFLKKTLFFFWMKVLEAEVGTKNPLKKELNLGRPLGIVFHGFWLILEAKLSQVGMENRAKIDQKAHGQYDEKKKASWKHLGGVLEA